MPAKEGGDRNTQVSATVGTLDLLASDLFNIQRIDMAAAQAEGRMLPVTLLTFHQYLSRPVEEK